MLREDPSTRSQRDIRASPFSKGGEEGKGESTKSCRGKGKQRRKGK